MLRWYEQDALDRFALPLGGIGTGTISLGGRGNLRDFELLNRPAKGHNPSDCLLALRIRDATGRVVVRALEGPIPAAEIEGAFGSGVPAAGLPRFDRARCGCAYPFARVELEDDAIPLRVALEAWNPLVPGDPDASAWPVAALRVQLENPQDVAVQVSLLATHRFWLPGDGTPVIEERRQGALRAVLLSRQEGDPAHPDRGTICLATRDEPGSAEVQVRTGWLPGRWQRGRKELWQGFARSGRIEACFEDVPEIAALNVALELAPHAATTIPVFIAWHFPNRAVFRQDEHGRARSVRIGNHHTERFGDAWEVAARFEAEAPALEQRTRAFLGTLLDSDLPEVIAEAALANLSTLRSTTVIRLPSGQLWGYEGSGDAGGCCPGSCTHVWNYELATPWLFGSLARSMREVEFECATDEHGLQSFRVELPLGSGGNGIAAADGQLGTLVRLWREWRLCGDASWLRRLWPHARRALEFCWGAGAWDADEDGVLEGCQHNTMDVEYYGPNPQMQGWYVAALRAGADMASFVGDEAFAGRCLRLAERGARWMDENLFNGEYYEHEIRPLRPEELKPGLRSEMGAADPERPTLQLGPGCLVDQLVGEWLARLSGLGRLHDPALVRRTLESILRFNHRDGFRDHLNAMRVFALGDETGLLMASYPRGGMPEDPFPYHSEVMTGFEYVVASHCILEGMEEEGLRVIRDIRSRYDGARRNPFDEAECGHHYVRAMASWGAILAYTGFGYDAVKARLAVRAANRDMLLPWSNGSAWGTIRQTHGADGSCRVGIEVVEGRLRLEQVAVGDREIRLAEPQEIGAGELLAVCLPAAPAASAGPRAED